MPYNPLGFKTLSHIGSLLGLAGTMISKHAYITDDSVVVLETSGYFNAIQDRLPTGSQIDCTIVITGVPVRKDYVAVNTAGVMTLIAAAA